MRILSMNKVTSYLAATLIATSLFVSMTASAMPCQGTLSTTAKSEKEPMLAAKTESSESKKAPVLVRNAVAKSALAAPTATVQKNQDKKTVGRCWQRLMTMVREVSHAHRTSNNQ
ncbi:hypothetical protein [Spirosoma validum]|uniref:Uncharacterized protein n=1 Tax=Spirosoma validum TaxID=2771355 RepID=A0A927AXZ4_9BACT|nr:hypothetical protein [Spirosoma validum]MBD2751742.1 hypothetical protein [Spirosoma validum]